MKSEQKDSSRNLQEIIQGSSILVGFLHPGNTTLQSTYAILADVLPKTRLEVENSFGTKNYESQVRTTIKNAGISTAFGDSLENSDIFKVGEIIALIGYQLGDYHKAGTTTNEILKRLVKIKAFNYPGLGVLEKTKLLLTSLLAIGVNWKKEIANDVSRLKVFRDFFEKRPDLNS